MPDDDQHCRYAERLTLPVTRTHAHTHTGKHTRTHAHTQRLATTHASTNANQPRFNPLLLGKRAGAMPKRPWTDLEACSSDDDCSMKIIKAVAPRRTDRLAARHNLRGSVFRGMLKMCLPFAFFNILFQLTISHQSEDTQCLDFIDMYMGEAAVRNGMRDHGMVSVGFDIRNDPWQDSLSDRGILMMFQMFRRLKDRGGSHWGTVCSTWVWVARASTFRYLDAPMGLEGRQSEKVLQANRMVSIMCCFLLWMLCRGSSWCVEQPASSLMTQHFRFIQVKRQCRSAWRIIGTSMAAFGGETSKPTELYANCAWAEKQARPHERVIDAKKVCEIDEFCQVSGISEDLKNTQTYPKDYGVAVARSYKESLAEINDEERWSCSDATEDLMGELDDWNDANFGSVCAYVGVASDQLCAQW